MSQQERFDGLFMTAVQNAQGIEPFFDALFSFFGRKTDFYTQEEKAMTTVNQFLTMHIGEFKANVEAQKAINAKKKEADEKAKAQRLAREAAAAKKKAEEEAAAKEAEDAQCEEVTEEQAALIEAEERARKANPAAAQHVDDQAASADAGNAEPEEEKKDEYKGEQPNEGNGGDTDNYHWEQTLAEITVNVAIPEGVTSRQLTVDIQKQHLKVGVKGQPLIIDGPFVHTVKKSDCIWCIETDNDGKRFLQITLSKKDNQRWWNTVIEGDKYIDTGKVEPENSKLSDLDGETRQTVEKMMYDQR